MPASSTICGNPGPGMSQRYKESPHFKAGGRAFIRDNSKHTHGGKTRQNTLTPGAWEKRGQCSVLLGSRGVDPVGFPLHGYRALARVRPPWGLSGAARFTFRRLVRPWFGVTPVAPSSNSAWRQGKAFVKRSLVPRPRCFLSLSLVCREGRPLAPPAGYGRYKPSTTSPLGRPARGVGDGSPQYLYII